MAYKRYIAYFKYLFIHKYYVYKFCRKLKLSVWQSVLHDWSKFLPIELVPYAKYFYNNDGTKRNIRNPDGSYDPTKIGKDFDYSWLSHQRRNKHHWQHWLLMNDSGSWYPLEIPDKYIKEMVADWCGAGYAKKKKLEVSEWYKENKSKMILHSDTRKKIEDLISKIICRSV
jgi:hypothetical protein